MARESLSNEECFLDVPFTFDEVSKCIAGLRTLVRIFTYPAHVKNCCPKCDVSTLGEGMTLLAHVINVHTSAGFSAVELLNSVFEDTSSHFDLFFSLGSIVSIFAF